MRHETIKIKVDYQSGSYQHSGFQPKLSTYLLDNSAEIDPERKRPCVLICPGGSYMMTSDREAEPIAVQMMAMGYHAAVLRYSVAPARFPCALLELAQAMAVLREHADDWNIDPDRIVLMGFSAGGHLACSLSVFWQEEWVADALGCAKEQIKPNGLILSYPVITSGEFTHSQSIEALLGVKAGDTAMRERISLEKQVGPDAPPAFVWHTFTDDAVPVENALLLADAYRKRGLSMELHVYPEGGHGLSLSTQETGGGVVPSCQNWIKMAGAWIGRLSHT